MEQKNAYLFYEAEDEKALEALSRAYRDFLDGGKTERECVALAIRAAREKGFAPLREKKSLAPGDKLYDEIMGKSLILYVVGKRPLEEGLNLLGAHLDSPRLDVKPNPLYEEDGLAYLDTHYYGGIKKYQWAALPLALHGVIAKKDGTVVTLSIGEDEADPVFCVTDLLPHLAKDQMEKSGRLVIEGENLDVVIGSRPTKGAEKEPVLENLRALIRERYGFEEEDFLSAELEFVPAGRARDLGLDRSMILSYGHDDRCCAFPSLKAILEMDGIPEYGCGCVLTDKEEIGSVGATGMRSRYFENSVVELSARLSDAPELTARRALANSRMLSSDVSAGYDPRYADAFEKKNSAFLGRGLCFNKYTGSGGKSSSNDANAEYIARLRALLDGARVRYQSAEMGRVDKGGGGTIAYMCAHYGMEVIDAGLPVLSMHAPWEAISKADLYESLKAYRAFLAGMGNKL